MQTQIQNVVNTLKQIDSMNIQYRKLIREIYQILRNLEIDKYVVINDPDIRIEFIICNNECYYVYTTIDKNNESKFYTVYSHKCHILDMVECIIHDIREKNVIENHPYNILVKRLKKLLDST